MSTTKQGHPVESCFRKYANVVECFADHSAFIRNPQKEYRYGFLFELDPLDYKAWAEGLQRSGYSSVDYYGERLVHYIELYQLNDYDRLAASGQTGLKRSVESKRSQYGPGSRANETLDGYCPFVQHPD